MKALIVISAVLFILFLIMSASVSVDLSYIDGKLDYRVKYFIFQLFPSKIKLPVRKKKNDTSEVSDNKNKSDKKSFGIMKKTDIIIEVLEESADDIKKFGKRISVSDIYIFFLSRNEDAMICAVNYGIMNGMVYNAVAAASSVFRTTFKSVSIGMCYNESGNIYDISFTVKMKLGTGIKTAVIIIFRYLKINYRKSKEN